MSQFFPAIGNLAEITDGLPEQPVAPDADPGAQEPEKTVEEIESLCMRCGEQGMTRMMLTSIPFFREVIVMSFRCEHCGATNNEIQSAGVVREQGVRYTLKVLHRCDLDRQIVRSQACEISIPEFELTLPPNERGQLTTVEGLLRDIVADLGAEQPLRRIQNEAAYTRIQEIIDGLKDVIDDDDNDDDEQGDVGSNKPVVEKLKDDPVKKTVTITLDDPSGNSFLEFIESMADPKWSLQVYTRTPEQAASLGLAMPDKRVDDTPKKDARDGVDTEVEGENDRFEGENDEVFEFPGICPRCGRSLVTRMKKVSIPYFKETLIMSTNCESCGYRDNEVKAGSAISEKGKRITLKVIDQEDLRRDILKSETAGLTIPEIELVLQHGTLGGRFTTLEGILDQVYEELSQKLLLTGDSNTIGDREKFQKFLENLNSIKQVEREFTIILDDPLANSYVQNIYAPDPDPNMTIELYDRSWEQNEELGLNDIKVESYSGDNPVGCP